MPRSAEVDAVGRAGNTAAARLFQNSPKEAIRGGHGGTTVWPVRTAIQLWVAGKRHLLQDLRRTTRFGSTSFHSFKRIMILRVLRVLAIRLFYY